MTLAVHLVWSAVRGCRIARVHVVVTVLLQLLDTTRWSLVLTGDLSTGLVANRRKLDLLATTLLIAGRRLSVVARRSIGGVGLSGGSSSTFLLSLTLVLFLLLTCFPFLANLLEFCERDTG
jgi:hypothetical protein